MAYDEALAERVRELMPQATERRMFGAVCWMERGHLVVGVMGDELLARVGPAGDALLGDGVRPFDFTGKPMSGWVMVAQELLPEDEELAAWLCRAREFTATLPAK